MIPTCIVTPGILGTERASKTYRPPRIHCTDQRVKFLRLCPKPHPNGTAPIAEDGVKRIGDLYRIEAELRGLNPEARLTGRQERSVPLVADMQTWLVHHRARVATKSPLGEALAYIAKYWDGLKLSSVTFAVSRVGK